MRITDSRSWWTAKKGEVNRVVIPYVRTVENTQAEIFDKFVKLEATYDVNSRTNRYVASTNMAARLGRARAIVTENLIAAQVDTVAAHVADTDISIEIDTDGADWSHQRTAKRLGAYLDGLATLFEVGPKCRAGFKGGAAMKGTGVNKVYIDQFDQIRVTPVPIDNIIVDELECRDGKPRQLHYRDFFDREDLMAQFPDHAEEISRAQTGGSINWRLWAGYRPMQTNEVVVIESWRLPIGPRDHERYIPGRHVLTIDGCDLLDEEYHDPYFPFAKMVWNAPIWGFYGISLAERILPHQNLLNRRNYQINRSLDKKADPITYVHHADQNLAVKTVNEIGSVAVYKNSVPTTVDHQAVGRETYDSKQQIKVDAASESGISQDMTSGGVPAGIESGVGVREVRQTRTTRFSIQEKAFENFWLDTMWLVLMMCKKLGGTKAPEILKVSKYGNRRIKWSQVDMDDIRIQMRAKSTLAKTPAGRQQRVTELAQAGVITLDEARELMDHPDIERILSLYNSALEGVQAKIELILDGEIVTPGPFDNLQMCTVIGQREYNLIEREAPEDILEALADFIAIAANKLNPPAPPQQPQQPGMPMPPPGAPPPGMPAPDMGGMPQAAFAQGAFSPMTA